MKLSHSLLLLTGLLLLLVSSCASVSTTKTSASFNEDLTQHRMEFDSKLEETASNTPEEVEEEPFEEVTSFTPEYDITYELDSLMDSVSVYNQRKKFFQGYTIQVYTGTSREEASDVRSELYRILPDTRSRIAYEIPNYKVKLGKFYTRIEAENIFSKIKSEFPAAILVPEEFRIEDKP